MLQKFPLLLLLSLSFPLAACESMPRSAKSQAASHAGDDADADDTDEDDSPEEVLAQKSRDLEYARIDLAIAEADVQASKRKADDAVVSAENALRDASEELEHFLKSERDHELSELALGLDQAAWRVEAEKQELAELEAMYRKDDVATLTKELVLQRGQKSVEFAERALLHAQREAAMKREYELPRKQRELEIARREAEHELRDAKAEADKGRLEDELKLKKARAELTDAEKAVQKARAKAARSKSAAKS